MIYYKIQQFSFGIICKENENKNSKRYMHSHVHNRVIYKSQDMEITQVSINR